MLTLQKNLNMKQREIDPLVVEAGIQEAPPLLEGKAPSSTAP